MKTEKRECEICGRRARETGSEPRCDEHGEKEQK